MKKMLFKKNWQSIFAVSLALLMLSGCMGGSGRQAPVAAAEPPEEAAAEPTETIREVTAIPVADEAEPPESRDEPMESETTAAPTGEIERIDILYLDRLERESGRVGLLLGDDQEEQGSLSPTMLVGDPALHFVAAEYPLGAAGELRFEWSSSDEEALKLTPTEDGGCDVDCVGTHPGGVVITVRVGDAEGRCRIYTMQR